MNDMTAVRQVRPIAQATGGKRASASHFWFVALTYLVFNILLAPSETWADMSVGWWIQDPQLRQVPFLNGSFFFLAVVLNSDSIFRAVQHQAITKVTSIPLMCGILSSFILLAFGLLFYVGVGKHTASGQPPDLVVFPQILCAVLALSVGGFVHYRITLEDFDIRPA